MRSVAQAVPGLFTEEQIRWDLPPERGWAYIHNHTLAQGTLTEWG